MTPESEQRDIDFLLEFREFKGEVNTKLDRAISDISNLQHSFVTRDEFMTLKKVVHGDTGEGGLMREQKDLATFINRAIGGLIILNFISGIILALYVSGKL